MGGIFSNESRHMPIEACQQRQTPSSSEFIALEAHNRRRLTSDAQLVDEWITVAR